MVSVLNLANLSSNMTNLQSVGSSWWMLVCPKQCAPPTIVASSIKSSAAAYAAAVARFALLLEAISLRKQTRGLVVGIDIHDLHLYQLELMSH
jgi:hypothetical protein